MAKGSRRYQHILLRTSCTVVHYTVDTSYAGLGLKLAPAASGNLSVMGKILAETSAVQASQGNIERDRLS